jgi:orotate phosphoribosyltransferase
MHDLIEELRELLQQRSIQRGRFTLASGDVSNYYCDTKATTLSPEGNYLVGEVLFHLATTLRCEAIGGLMMGGPLVASAVANSSYRNGTPIYAFAVRDRQKEHGLKHLIEESYHPDGTPLIRTGRRVCVVDDVITKGGSVLKAVDAVTERGAEVAAVVALVDRNAGGREALAERGLDYIYLYATDAEGELHVNDDFLRRIRSNPGRAAAWAVR